MSSLVSGTPYFRASEQSDCILPAAPFSLPVGSTAIVYCEGQFGEQDGKTANGLVRHSEKYDIEVAMKPAQPWGDRAQAAFGEAPVRTGSRTVHQAILALGRQDVDPDGLQPPKGMTILGMSSDHLVVDLGDHPVTVGDEIDFGVGYGALVRAMTSPFVTKIEQVGRSVAPGATQMPAPI
jgi:hypothetical protein